MTKEKVLITGSSRGIGLELARVFAENGHPLVLVAPVAEELETIASEFETQYNADAWGSRRKSFENR